MLLSMTRAMILNTADSNGCMCPKFGGKNGGTEMAAHLTGKTMKSGALCYREKLMISGKHRLALVRMD